MTFDELKRADWLLDQLKEISHKLHRLDENACNYGLTKRQETREKNLEKEATELTEEMGKLMEKTNGLRIYRQGDPRGCSLYLIDDSCGSDYTRGMAIY